MSRFDVSSAVEGLPAESWESGDVVQRTYRECGSIRSVMNALTATDLTVQSQTSNGKLSSMLVHVHLYRCHHRSEIKSN